MALSIVCPGCDADYNVPDTLLGKAIRCKKCGETIDVKARPKVKAARYEDDDEDDRPRKAVPRRRDDDDDDYETKKKGTSPALIGGLVAVLIAAVGAGAYFALAGDDPKPNPTPVVQNDRKTTPVNEGATDEKPVEKKADEKKEETKPEEKKTDLKSDEKKVDDKKADEKKADDKRSDDKKAANPKNAANPDDKKTAEQKAFEDALMKPTNSGGSPGSMSPGGVMPWREYFYGEMSGLTQSEVKKSTVMMKVDGASGSGWFGFAPNIVVTNAHVVDMLGRDAKPPKKIEIIMNSGTNEERIIPHQNIKILAVDGRIDLAILQISNEKDLPPPLKVRNANELRESQKLHIFGFPLGGGVQDEADGNKKNPKMAVRPTTVTAKRENEFGQLFTVMMEGGMTNGNSGGPIVDAEGCVVAVVVRGYVNYGRGEIEQLLGSGIPSEWVTGLLAGRLNEVRYGEPYKAGDKVKIPVTVKMLDPMKRVKEVGIRHWIGANNDKYREPGQASPNKEGDTAHKEVSLKYDEAKATAKGEIEVDPVTAEKTIYWGQVFYTTAVRPKFYEPGVRINVETVPVIKDNANLVSKPKEGQTRTVTITQNASFQVVEDNNPDGPPRSSRETTMTAKETVGKADTNDTNNAAKIRLDFEGLNVVAKRGGMTQAITGPEARTVNDLAKKVRAVAQMNKTGAIYKTKADFLNMAQGSQNVNPALISAVYRFTNESLDAYAYCSVSLPNGEKKPGDEWTDEVTHAIPYDIELPPNWRRGQPINIDDLKLVYARFIVKTTYRYVGTREKEGRRTAVVEVDGEVLPIKGKSTGDTKGHIRGRAVVDLENGTVLENVLDVDYAIDVSGKGIRQRLIGTGYYKVTRTATSS